MSSMLLQVVRHERASVKADMWSYGILIWELVSDQDITNLQPLAIAQAMQVIHGFILLISSSALAVARKARTCMCFNACVSL